MIEMMKKFLVFLLAICLCISFFGTETVWAAQMPDESPQTETMTTGQTGGLLWNEVELTEDETKELLAQSEPINEDGTLQSESTMLHSALYANEWDQYSTNYIYNQLSSQLRNVWDQLDEICLKYLTTDADMPTISAGGVTAYALDEIASSSISTSVLNNLGLLFKYCNPQYYFLNDYVYSGTVGSDTKRTNIFTIGVYTKFASGKSRSVATKRMQNQLENWKSTLSVYTSDYDIALAAHDLLNDKVTYNENISDENYDENSHYSQSAYGALCTDSTVCAGYTLAYEMIMNAMGIDCIGVTSDNHAWNKVILNDNWYNVDCTWDDTGGNYFYFARNDINIKGDGCHNPTGMWVYYLPDCTLDTYSGYVSAGTLPVIASCVQTPQITVAKSTDGYLITIETDTKNADIYYTTDGTAPSCAATRSTLYSTGFIVTTGTQIRAIAVADQALNSKEASVLIQASESDTDTNTGNSADTDVSSDIDTGLNTKNNNIKTTTPDTINELQIPDMGTKSQTSDESTKKTVQTYTILFRGNKNTSGSMSKLRCIYGKSYRLPANKFIRTGYTFTGWNTKADGKGKSYKNKAVVKNLTVTSKEKIILYAQWKRK